MGRTVKKWPRRQSEFHIFGGVSAWALGADRWWCRYLAEERSRSRRMMRASVSRSSIPVPVI